MSKQSRAKPQTYDKVEVPYPSTFIQGLRYPAQKLMAFLRRPFSWMKIGLACVIVFLPLTSLTIELLAQIFFSQDGPVILQNGRQFVSSFMSWLFGPAVICVSLAGAIRFIGNGKLGYGVVLEPLKSRTEVVVGLGIFSAVIAVAAIGIGRIWGAQGALAATILMMLVWKPIISMATTQMWANETGFLQSLKWGILATARTWKPWLGIGISYLLGMVVAIFIAIAFSNGVMKLGLSQVWVGGIGLGALLFAGLAATWLLGLDGLISLSMHSAGMASEPTPQNAKAQKI